MAAAGNTDKSSSGNSSSALRLLLKWVVLPYIIGWAISDVILPPGSVDTTAIVKVLLPFVSNTVNETTTATSATGERKESRILVEEEEEIASPHTSDTTTTTTTTDLCWQRFLKSLERDEAQVVEELLIKKSVTLVLHRNGDVEGCGMTTNFLDQLRWTLNTLDECPVAFNKYDVESILTSAFHHTMKSTCYSEESDREEDEGFLGYCDMGESKTPRLLDHDKLVPVAADYTEEAYLPCHFHSREGVRITSFQKLVSRIVKEYQKECSTTEKVCDAKEVHFYAVPAGRVFMFAPSYVGEIFDLPHIQGADPTQPVYMEVLSLSPRVFDIFNYFTREESAGLVEKAIAETSDSHRIKRSSTGASGYNINTRRTSESGFDTHGRIAQIVKRRCFSVLGFDEYIEGHSDGLQILRYNQTKAYTSHMDWIDDDGKQEHDYNSAGKGGNRYATILLYMTDLGEDDGGETVFVNGKPLGDNPPKYQEALDDIRQSKHAAILKQDSWEEKMVAKCRSSLSIRPNSARAVLFYSQHPNGQPDQASLHGGCPVLTDEPKWAANLWVWNTPRAGFAGAPVNEDRVAANKKKGVDPTPNPNVPPKKHVTFINTGNDPEYENAELYYIDQFWSKLGDGDPPQAVNSYEGQVWNIQVDGVVKKTWTVNKDPVQKYTI